MEARLRVIDALQERVVVLDRPRFSIGRHMAADLNFSSVHVSREHAEIVQRDAGFVLRDRASRYGTFVNGERITERVLQHGDRIRLGRAEAIDLIFLVAGAETVGLLDSSADMSGLRQMAAILDGLRALGSGRVLEEVLALVIDSALEVTRAERGFIMLRNASDNLEFKIARGRGRTTLPGTTFSTSLRIPLEVLRTGKSVMVPDLVVTEGSHGETVRMGIRQALCVPLLVAPMSQASASDHDHRVIGVLYLDGATPRGVLSESRQSSLEAFGTQAALAIESARLYAESAEKARTDRDLRIAAEIQRALLPEPLFENAVLDLAAASLPCRTVGGDFYDYLDVGEQFGFTLGDVAGKGPPAALLAAAVQTHFSALAPISADPAQVMDRINQALLRRAIEARFATMFYGAVTPEGRLSYCNAGQEPPLVVGRQETRWLEAGGPVLGLLPHASYTFETVQLEPGDLVVVCSDGVTEARNRAGDEFGRDRMVEAVCRRHGAQPDAALEDLLAAVKSFSDGEAQGDDLTALVLRYRGGI
jgi:sigma-B regulation protein RsbU (phosphoserine phosphatase)